MTVTGVITALARSSGVDLDGFLEFGLARLVAPRRHAQLGWAGYGPGSFLRLPRYAEPLIAAVGYHSGPLTKPSRIATAPPCSVAATAFAKRVSAVTSVAPRRCPSAKYTQS